MPDPGLIDQIFTPVGDAVKGLVDYVITSTGGGSNNRLPIPKVVTADNGFINHWKRYAEAEDFFSLAGSVVMKLTPEAAIGVCERAAERGLLISRIEGGIWWYPGFEARIDCIWDGAEPPLDMQAAHKNNLDAIEFIRSELPEHDAFVITSVPTMGRVR